MEPEIRTSGLFVKGWNIKYENWDLVWSNSFHMLLELRSIRWAAAVAVHVCMSTCTHIHRGVFHSGPVHTTPCSAETESLFFGPRSTSMCAGYLCQRTRGRGWARMEMFEGRRGHEGWVDCWVMSHWSLLQSLLSNPNTRAGRSTGIWAYGWKSWVGRPHTVCIHMNDSAHPHTHIDTLHVNVTGVRISLQRMWPVQQRLLQSVCTVCACLYFV